MPSPFVHLDIAEQVKAVTNGRLSARLSAAWPAFCLGSIAPDYPTINQASRASSHFYDLPPADDNLGYNTMLRQHPRLARPAALPGNQAIFVAAYCAHLMLDLIWLREVVLPYFTTRPDLGDRQSRRRLHFVLLTYLDQQALQRLPAAVGHTLQTAVPRQWLPFVSDGDLCRWRDMVAGQLAPDGEIETVNIYAERLGMTSAAFAACLEPAWLQANLFTALPVPKIEARLATAVNETINIVRRYLQGDLAPGANNPLESNP